MLKNQHKEIGVLRMEDWVSIKNLKTKNPDLGTRKIASLLGVSRNYNEPQKLNQ